MGHVFTQAGNLTDTVPGMAGGCDTARPLPYTTLFRPTATHNITVCANQLPYTWMGHVFTQAGNLTDTVPGVAGGCDTVRTLTLAVTPLLTATHTIMQ